MDAILLLGEKCHIHCCDILSYSESIWLLFTLLEYETVKLSIIDHNTFYNEKISVWGENKIVHRRLPSTHNYSHFSEES